MDRGSLNQEVGCIVVAGMGAVTCFGSGLLPFWNAQLSSQSGVRLAKTKDAGTRFCARVEDSSSSPRVIEYARKAAQEALDGAYSSCSGLRNINPRACGVVVGTAGGVRTEWDLSGGQVFNPYIIEPGKDPFHGIAENLARVTGFAGPCATVNTACTSGATACGVAFEWIRQGIVELALVCGADEFTEYSAMGFELIGAYAQGPCAPLARPEGLSLGEGAGALVLCNGELIGQGGENTSARMPRVEMFGFGLSNDAYHPTAPDPSGRVLASTIERALAESGCSPDEVGYVNVHGTGTPANDMAERQAIAAALVTDTRVRPLYVSGCKGSVGHTLGAAGALEVILTILAIERGVIPGSPNAAGIEVDQWDDKIVTVLGRQTAYTQGIAISINSAFGGQNSCLVVGPLRNRDGEAAGTYATLRPGPDSHASLSEVSVVGTGVCLPSDIANGKQGTLPAKSLYCLTDDDHDIRTPPEGISPRDWRRLDRYSRLAVYAVHMAICELRATAGDATSVLFSTERGPTDSSDELHKAVRQGRRPSPGLYARLAFTFPVGSICQLLGLKGPCATFASGRIGAISAIGLAKGLLEREACERAIVVATETVSDYSRGMPRFRTGQSVLIDVASAVVLEKKAQPPQGRQVSVRDVLFGRPGSSSSWAGTEDTTEWRTIIEECQRGDLDRMKIAFGSRHWQRSAKFIAEALGQDVPIEFNDAVFGDMGAASALVSICGFQAAMDDLDSRDAPQRLVALEEDSAGTLGAVVLCDAARKT